MGTFNLRYSLKERKRAATIAVAMVRERKILKEQQRKEAIDNKLSKEIKRDNFAIAKLEER